MTTVIQAPEFSLVKYGSSSPVCAGSLLTYTTVVSNVGPDPLLDVIAVPYTEVDKLPPQVDLVWQLDLATQLQLALAPAGYLGLGLSYRRLPGIESGSKGSVA